MYAAKSKLIPSLIALAAVAACGDEDPIIESDATADVTDATGDAIASDTADAATDAAEDAAEDAGTDATEDVSEDSDAATDTTEDTSADATEDATEDAEPDATEDASADTGEEIALTAGEAAAVCGSGDDPLLTASPTGDPGAIIVTHAGFSMGCCPEFLRVSATANQGTSTINVSYELGPDPCDCICTLDTAYTLSGIPTGSWTVEVGGDSATVEVP